MIYELALMALEHGQQTLAAYFIIGGRAEPSTNAQDENSMLEKTSDNGVRPLSLCVVQTDAEEEEDEERDGDGDGEAGGAHLQDEERSHIVAAASGADADTKSEDAVNAYVAEREARIAKNRERMLQLMGVSHHADVQTTQRDSTSIKKKNTTAKRARKAENAATRVSMNPPRRSKRVRDGAAAVAQKKEEEEEEEEEEQNEREEELKESRVARYTCARENVPVDMLAEFLRTRGQTHAGTRVPKLHFMSTFQHPKVVRAYSITSSQDLIAVGGKGGYAAVDGLHDQSARNEPLMSFRAHMGWIADMRLVLRGESKQTLLSVGNDCALCAWDLCEQNTSTGAPRQLVHSTSVHNGGIFSMDCIGADAESTTLSILTASKDSSVCLSRLDHGFTNLSVVRSFDAHHEGVIKCARFCPVDENVFADCGNDMKVCVVDVRDHSSRNASITIQTTHGRAVNRITWHPLDRNLLLSTSFGATILMHDIRRADQPVFEFVGHTPYANHKNIYEPVFMNTNAGCVVVSPGIGSGRLSVYNARDGLAISRGDVGFDASCLGVLKPSVSSVGPTLTPPEILLACHGPQTSLFLCGG